MQHASVIRGASPGAVQPHGDVYARYRFVGTAFALIILAAAVLEFIANAGQPTARDFISFWGAAQLALSGNPAGAYDLQSIHAVQAAVASFGDSGARMPFPYPPAYLALVTPFGLLPFPAAMVLWTGRTFAFYLWAARRLMPQVGWLPAALPAVYANAAIGQNAFLTAGLLMLGLSLVKRRPFAAGLVLGCLVIKPQLGLMLPFAFLAIRAWHVIGGAILSAVSIMIAGALLFGPSVTAAWLQQLPLYGTITRDGLVGWSKLSSAYAFARGLGVEPGAALALHGAIAVAAAAAVWRIWRSSQSEQFLKVAILCAATALASPYFFFYDAVILAPALLFLAARVQRPCLILVLWSLPLVQLAQIGVLGTPVNANSIMALATAALVYWQWRARRGSASAERAPLRIEQPSGVTFF